MLYVRRRYAYYADALIAFIAIVNNLELMTRDRHFKLIQVVSPELRLAE